MENDIDNADANGMQSPPKPTRFAARDISDEVYNPSAVLSLPTEWTSAGGSKKLQLSTTQPMVPPKVQEGLSHSGRMATATIMCADIDATGGQDMEGRLLRRALDSSLPTVMEELVVQQRDQTLELDRLQQLLEQNKKIYKEVQVNISITRKEVVTLQRAVSLSEGETEDKEKVISELKYEINELIGSVTRLKENIEKSENRLSVQEELFKTCETKRRSHKDRVDVDQSRQPAFHTLQEHRDKVDALQTEKKQFEENAIETKNLLSGECLEELNAAIMELTEEKENVDSGIFELRAKLVTVKEDKLKIKQSIDIIKKRNAAHLTCLKRQLSEVQMRNRQWNEEATQLEKTITDIKQNPG